MLKIGELQRSGIDLDDWLEGFHDTEKSVRTAVATIVNHPLIPSDVVVRGFYHHLLLIPYQGCSE